MIDLHYATRAAPGKRAPYASCSTVMGRQTLVIDSLKARLRLGFPHEATQCIILIFLERQSGIAGLARHLVPSTAQPRQCLGEKREQKGARFTVH